jgi:hypothetical protein
MLLRRLAPVMAVAVLVALLSPVGARAQAAPGGVDCGLPESNADALVILSNSYPGYWWDHTDLTVAVQAHPSATDEQLAAIRGAIATWDRVLRRCFDGLITLTDVSGAKRKTADIVVHYVPTAGGVVFGGYAICGAHRCPNILVRSDLPPSLDREPYDPEPHSQPEAHPNLVSGRGTEPPIKMAWQPHRCPGGCGCSTWPLVWRPRPAACSCPTSLTRSSTT